MDIRETGYEDGSGLRCVTGHSKVAFCDDDDETLCF
jgi:hypothetical protein